MPLSVGRGKKRDKSTLVSFLAFHVKSNMQWKSNTGSGTATVQLVETGYKMNFLVDDEDMIE